MLLFACWVVSPFAGVLLADVVAKGGTDRGRPSLYLVMLAFSLGSVVIYGAVAFGWLTWKVGTTFLLVPAASWRLARTLGHESVGLRFCYEAAPCGHGVAGWRGSSSSKRCIIFVLEPRTYRVLRCCREQVSSAGSPSSGCRGLAPSLHLQPLLQPISEGPLIVRICV